jgi:hypothetical protein
MQKLSQIFEQLTQGELSQVAMGGGAAGEISEANYRAVGNHVLLGLTTLYRRFDLKRNQLVVELSPDRTTYQLHSKFAVQGLNSLEPVRYIKDTVDDPFRDDLLKILTITTDNGDAFNLNDYMDHFSIVTPTLESIRVPIDVVNPGTELAKEYRTANLVIDYQANHPNFVPKVGFYDPQLTNIELPAAYTQALLYFVASRVHNPIGMGQEFNAGNNWAARFEGECQRLENEGVEIDSLAGNTRAERGGWR